MQINRKVSPLHIHLVKKCIYVTAISIAAVSITWYELSEIILFWRTGKNSRITTALEH